MSEAELTGVVIGGEDGVYVIPADELDRFRLDQPSTELMRESVGDGDVAGFTRRKVGVNAPKQVQVKELDFAIAGPLKPMVLDMHYEHCAPVPW